MSPISFKVTHSQKLSDSLLGPLRFCGSKWNEINDNYSKNIIYKTWQVALRIIPGAILTIATTLAFVPGLLGSLIKSYDPGFATPWIPFVFPSPWSRSSMSVEIPMNFQTIQKCKSLALHFIGKDLLAARLYPALPTGMLSLEDVTHNYGYPNNLTDIAFHLETSKHSIFHSIAQCFNQKTDQEKASLLVEFKNVIVGLETNPTRQTEVIEAVSSIFRDVTIHMSNDFKNMSIQAYV